MTRTDPRVAAVRRFNRFYTRQIGVLRKTFLGSPYSLTEARVLYEIANDHATTASEIGRKLDLDAGYLSRTLRTFEKRGLIVRKRSARDTRQSHLALSLRGRRAFAPLEKRSQHDAKAMLGKLAVANRARLIGAMHTIETLLAGEISIKRRRRYTLRAPIPGDFGWVIKRHAELYRQEYGWKEPFEALCAQIVADCVNKNDHDRERCWIAEIDGENVGCVFLAKEFGDRGPDSPFASRSHGARARSRHQACRRVHSFRAAAPVTKKSRCGPTACWPRRGISIRKPALSSCAPNDTGTGARQS